MCGMSLGAVAAPAVGTSDLWLCGTWSVLDHKGAVRSQGLLRISWENPAGGGVAPSLTGLGELLLSPKIF